MIVNKKIKEIKPYLQPNYTLAHNIVDFLNSLLELDKAAIGALVHNSVQCSDKLADHETVQVVARDGAFHVGLLGILNGLCGANKGIGLIRAVFDESDDFRSFNIKKFYVE